MTTGSLECKIRTQYKIIFNLVKVKLHQLLLHVSKLKKICQLMPLSVVSTYSTDSLCTHQRYSLTQTSVEQKNADQQRPSDLHIRQTTENMGPCGLDFIWQINTYRSNENPQWLVHFLSECLLRKCLEAYYYYGEEICSQKIAISMMILRTDIKVHIITGHQRMPHLIVNPLFTIARIAQNNR